MKCRVRAAAVAVAGICGAAMAATKPAPDANTRWSPVSEDYRAEYFYDRRSVERTGGVIRLRMREMVRPERSPTVRSAIVKVQIDCAGQATSQLAFDLYATDGALLASSTPDALRRDVRRITPDTPEEVLYRRLCPASLVRPVPVPPPFPTFVTVGPPRTALPPPMPPAASAPPPPPNPSPPAVRARWLTSLESLVSGDDYPAAALRIRAQGTVRASLRVSPQGQVTDCTIDGSSGSALLDAATCRMLTARTGFAPARNRRGRPVFDIATAGVRWLIPVDWKPTLPEALRGSPH